MKNSIKLILGCLSFAILLIVVIIVVYIQPPKTYKIGDFAQGGIIFWLDETNQHGLACTKEAHGSPIRFFAGTLGNLKIQGDGPFSGEMNTALIIANYFVIGDDGNNYAARLCSELKINEGNKTYGDWYLPSIEELTLMYQNRNIISTVSQNHNGTDFLDETYWSSTIDRYSHSLNFANGQLILIGTSCWHYVRPIRAF